jgi:hypothetical protein
VLFFTRKELGTMKHNLKMFKNTHYYKINKMYNVLYVKNVTPMENNKNNFLLLFIYLFINFFFL